MTTAKDGGKVVSLTHRPPLPQKIHVLLISVRGWVDPRAIVRPEGLCHWKIPMTPSGIEPATFRFVSLCLNHYATARPVYLVCLFVCFPGVKTHCGCIFTARWRALASSFSRFLDQTQRRTTDGRTPLDKWSVRRRDLYLTTHKTHNRQTSMPPVGFEPTISAGERTKTYALDCAATGTGVYLIY
jgi:hypothetical protein